MPVFSHWGFCCSILCRCCNNCPEAFASRSNSRTFAQKKVASSCFLAHMFIITRCHVLSERHARACMAFESILRSWTHAGTWNVGRWKLCEMHLVGMQTMGRQQILDHDHHETYFERWAFHAVFAARFLETFGWITTTINAWVTKLATCKSIARPLCKLTWYHLSVSHSWIALRQSSWQQVR